MGEGASLAHRLGGQSFPALSRRGKHARQSLVNMPKDSDKPEPEPFSEEHDALLRALLAGESVTLPKLGAIAVNATSALLAEGSVVENEFDNAVRLLSRGWRRERKARKQEQERWQSEVLTTSSLQASSILQTKRRLETIRMNTWMSLPLEIPALRSLLDVEACPSVHSADHKPSTPDKNLSSSAENWEQSPTGVRQSACKLREKRAPNQGCHSLGLCVCRGEGKLHSRIKNKIATFLKGLSADPDFGRALLHSEVVLLWTDSSHRAGTFTSQQRSRWEGGV